MTTHKNNPPTQTEQHQLLNQKLDALNQFKIDLGLDRLQQVLGQLKLEKPAKQIITVGGTNGKGSTVAALCSLLKVKNKTFGAFTSPHIFTFNERINVNGKQATDGEILQAFDTIETARGDIGLSYFEFTFLAALLVFVKHQVDVVVLEVGLGGRLDATNTLDADATIITTVDIDHTEWLGKDIESIALEKAGIMRSDQPIVYGDHGAPQAIKTRAVDLQADLLLLDKEYTIQVDEFNWHYQYGDQQLTQLAKPAIKGDWQLKNFSSAITSMLALGYELTNEEVQQGITTWQIPGRLQTIQTEPLVLADVAHNRQAVQCLKQWLNANPVDGRTIAVFSVLADKELGSWLGLLDEVVDHWMIFELENCRTIKIDALKTTMADHVSLFSQFETAKQAYQMALSTAKSVDRILVFGSFHVLEEVFR